MAYNEDRLKALESAYRTGLAQAMEARPDDYMVKDADVVAGRMMSAVRSKGLGAVNVRQSDGFKRACKALGIKCTYRDIEAFLNG